MNFKTHAPAHREGATLQPNIHSVRERATKNKKKVGLPVRNLARAKSSLECSVRETVTNAHHFDSSVLGLSPYTNYVGFYSSLYRAPQTRTLPGRSTQSTPVLTSTIPSIAPYIRAQTILGGLRLAQYQLPWPSPCMGAAIGLTSLFKPL